MSDSPPYTIAQRDSLRRAIATGVLRVTHDGRSTEYRSLAEMERTLALVEAGLISAGLISAPSPTRRLRLIGTKGL